MSFAQLLHDLSFCIKTSHAKIQAITGTCTLSSIKFFFRGHSWGIQSWEVSWCHNYSELRLWFAFLVTIPLKYAWVFISNTTTAVHWLHVNCNVMKWIMEPFHRQCLLRKLILSSEPPTINYYTTPGTTKWTTIQLQTTFITNSLIIIWILILGESYSSPLIGSLVFILIFGLLWLVLVFSNQKCLLL